MASRGSVRLRSTDPAWHPAIDAAYLEDQTDLDALLAGARRTWEICTQGAVSRYLDRPWNLPDDPSDEDLVEHIRTWAQTLYHPVATCAMGSGEDAVVDAGAPGPRRRRASASSTPRSCPPCPAATPTPPPS